MKQALKIIVFIFIIGNLVFGTVFFLFGAGEFVKELAIKTGIIAIVNAIVVSGAWFIYSAVSRAWRGKSSKEMETDYRMLKCSVGNYMLPAACCLLVLMCVGMAVSRYQEFLEYIREAKISFQLLFPVFMALFGILFSFYLYYKRVLYNNYSIKFIRFIRKDIVIRWSEIKSIYFEKEGSGTILLTLKTRDKTYLLKSRILSDGWEDFMLCLNQMAEGYEIPVRMKREI